MYQYIIILIIFSDKNLKYKLVITMTKLVEKKIKSKNTNIFDKNQDLFIFESLFKNNCKFLVEYLDNYQNILADFYKLNKLNGTIDTNALSNVVVEQFAYYLDILMDKLNYKQELVFDLSYSSNIPQIGVNFIGYFIKFGYCKRIDLSFSKNIDYICILNSFDYSLNQYMTLDLRGVELTKKMIFILNDIRKSSNVKNIIIGEFSNSFTSVNKNNSKQIDTNSKSDYFNYDISDNIVDNRERKRKNKEMKKNNVGYGKGGFSFK